MGTEQVTLPQSGVSTTTPQQLLKNMDLELLGERIRQARTDQKISQRDLCKGLFTSAYLSYVELGKTRPTLANLEKLAERLHKPVEYFLRPSGLINSPKTPGGLEREQFRNLELQNQLTQGRVALSGNDFGQVETILAAVRTYLTRLPRPDQALFHLLEGGFYNALNEPASAATSLASAQTLVDSLAGSEAQGFLQAQLELEKGITLTRQDQPLKALDHFHKGLASARSLAKTPDKTSVYRTLLGETSRCYLTIGDPDKALEYSRQLLDLPEETLNEKAAALFNEGLRLAGLGDYQQSSFYLGRSAQVWQDRKEIAALQEMTLENAQVYLQTKKYPQALKTARLAFRLLTGYPQDKYSKPGELKALLLLVQIGLGMEDLGAVKTYMEQAEQIFQELAEKEPLEEARYYQVAGNAHSRLGNLEVATEDYQHALDILEPIIAKKSDSPDRTLLADVYYNFSQLLKRRDNTAKALEYLDKAFRLRSR
jgi:tetratricopeptide (TPR) repeat protein